ncbi:MAG: hypothetical protein GC181_07175 [Bacteroidetes bacterium]|nr:hypothetical protein [Bacteroidota bacterium]
MILYLVIFSGQVFSQSARQLYKKVKQANNSISDFEDSTFLIRCTLSNRFTQSNTSFLNTYLFPTKNYSYNFYGAKPGSSCVYNKFKIIGTGLSGDTFEINIKPYNFDRYHSNSFFFPLYWVPTFEKGDFSRRKFTRPKLIYHSNDTFALAQKNKVWNGTRIIYFTSNYRIFKYASFNDDNDRPDSAFNIEFNYFKGNCFDSLNREFNLGKFSIPPKNVTEELNRDTTVEFNKNSIPTINGNTIKSTSGKYILIDYWYLSCSPCLQMLPFVNELHEQIDTAKLIMFGVNPYDTKSNINRYISRKGYLIDQLDVEVMKPLHDINSFPTLILLDENLQEVKRFVGYGKRVSDSEIMKYLKSLDLLHN